MAAKDWTGQDVVCDKCDSKDTKYLGAVEHNAHDEGICEVFECRNCGNKMHIEIPDEHHEIPRG